MVTSVGGGSRQIDDRAGSGSRRSDSEPVREPLWTVRLKGRRISCELRYLGTYGVEYRLFQDNQFYQGRGFQTSELASQAAAAMRRQLESDGGVLIELHRIA